MEGSLSTIFMLCGSVRTSARQCCELHCNFNAVDVKFHVVGDERLLIWSCERGPARFVVSSWDLLGSSSNGLFFILRQGQQLHKAGFDEITDLIVTNPRNRILEIAK